MKRLAFTLVVLALLSCNRTPSYPEAHASGDEIRFSVDSLAEGVPSFHSLQHEGILINYLVLRINGRVESYFDACAKCSAKKLGYRVSGGHLVCVACGQRYPLEDLSGVGSCYPVPLKGRTEGDSYVIEKADIIEGAKYF